MCARIPRIQFPMTLTPLQELRHSAAHVLGAAVSRLHPEPPLEYSVLPAEAWPGPVRFDRQATLLGPARRS